MDKYRLQAKTKSSGTAYLCWFLLGCHYAYLGKWGIQIIYWLTLGGLGVWAFIDLFLIPGKIRRYNEKIFRQIDQIDKREHQKNLEMIMANNAGKESNL